MTTLTLAQQIEEMRIRMNQLAGNEQELVRALGEALSRADQKLLEDVRSLATEHEMRRGAILKELQSLAARMGALPRPRQPFAAIEEATAEAANPVPASAVPPPTPLAAQPVGARGDWRQAAANIRDELTYHLKARASAN